MSQKAYDQQQYRFEGKLNEYTPTNDSLMNVLLAHGFKQFGRQFAGNTFL